MHRALHFGHAYLLAALAVLLYFGWFLGQRALNFPYHDDILDILQFMLEFTAADSAPDRLSALFSQHNDHRTAASRLVYYFLYRLEGQVNFRSIALVANLAMPLMALLFCASVQSRKLRPLVALLVLLLLCHPRAYGLIVWPMSAFAFYFVCVYALLALYLLSRSGYLSFSLAIVAAIACNYTLASGQMVWPVGLLYIAWQVWMSREKTVIELLVWLFAAALSLYFYQSGHSSPNTVSQVLLFLWDTPCHQLGYFLAIVGSGLSFGSVAVALVLGVFIVSGFAALSLRTVIESRLGTVHLFGGFLLLSIFALALGRAPYSDLDYALVPRYSFASLNMVICLVLLCLGRNWGERAAIKATLSLAALVFCIASYRVYTPQLDDHLQHRIKHYNRGTYWIFGYPHKMTSDIVHTAVEKGLYQPPPRPFSLQGGVSR